jgi:hypothetical protein
MQIKTLIVIGAAALALSGVSTKGGMLVTYYICGVASATEDTVNCGTGHNSEGQIQCGGVCDWYNQILGCITTQSQATCVGNTCDGNHMLVVGTCISSGTSCYCD